MKRNIIILVVILMISIMIICFDKRNVTTIVIKSDNRRISMEEYLCETVMREAEYCDNIEAIKAMCVIVRSNFIRKYIDNSCYVVNEDKLNVKCNNKNMYMRNKIYRALRETKGEVLIYNGNIICAPFHIISNGKTFNKIKDKEIPYLRSVNCKEDIESTEYLKIKYYDSNKIDEINTKEMEIENSNYYFEKTGEKIRLVTRGVGHGYGMSLYSANNMGIQGHTYRQILNRFYKNIKLVKIY